MKRVPLIPTLIVGVACVIMVALGVWQVRRADEKAALLAQYASAATLPVMAFPAVADPNNLPLFRRAKAYCLSVANWRTKAGRNLQEESGWAHIAECRTGVEGPGFAVEAGWSRHPKAPDWKGGAVEGVITTDDARMIRLVSAVPLAAGLQTSAPPSPAMIPNNHLSYAIQWFAFALIALVIYGIALRRRPERA
ncbi:MAG TPA: SURF1 family protein [Chakrabartia sp.]|nr:SURF1 family protein [Chakrabartia sp.]